LRLFLRSGIYQGPVGDASPGEACKRAGISRSHFYEIKEAFEKCGAEDLARRARRRPRMPNQTAPELEQKILEMTERYPTFSYLRIPE